MPEPIKPIADEQPPKGAPATPPEEKIVTPPAPGPDASHEEKTRFQTRIDQLTAARRSAEERARLAEERAAQLEAEKARNSAPVSGTGLRPGQKTDMVGTISRDDWNEWHAEDPAAAIEYLADIKADQKAKHVMSQLEQSSQVEKTISEVYKAHPELKEVMNGEKAPEEVPFWQVYDEVAREMPDARYLAKGPLIVMKEAERRMKEKELTEREKSIAANAASDEQDRQVRVGASHTLGSKVAPPAAGSVKLTPEEERVARKMRLTPEEYAKFKK